MTFPLRICRICKHTPGTSVPGAKLSFIALARERPKASPEGEALGAQRNDYLPFFLRYLSPCTVIDFLLQFLEVRRKLHIPLTVA